MSFPTNPTWSQIDYISRLQNSPFSRNTVRRYLLACGKGVTNELTRKEASELIDLLIFVKSNNSR